MKLVVTSCPEKGMDLEVVTSGAGNFEVEVIQQLGFGFRQRVADHPLEGEYTRLELIDLLLAADTGETIEALRAAGASPQYIGLVWDRHLERRRVGTRL